MLDLLFGPSRVDSLEALYNQDRMRRATDAHINYQREKAPTERIEELERRVAELEARG